MSSKAASLRVLIVEDEPDIRRALADRFAHWGVAVDAVASAEEARDGLAKALPDACILDIVLPGEDGISLCKWLRKERGFRGPVIFLTSRDTVPERVVGLEAGGDDYVTKPYDFRELVARLRAQLRPKEATGSETLSAGPLKLDASTRRALLRGKALTLTHTEFELLALLVRSTPQAVSRQDVLRAVWGYSDEAAPNTRTVDMHIARLREKLGSAREHLQSVPGVGYRFQP